MSGERAGGPVDLVDHHYIDPLGPDGGKPKLQGESIERAAREPAIVITLAQQGPALVRLTLDVCSRGLALGIERVELLLQIVVGRDPGVDGTPQPLALPALGRTSRSLGSATLVRRPKKRRPFQRVPVMARAT